MRLCLSISPMACAPGVGFSGNDLKAPVSLLPAATWAHLAFVYDVRSKCQQIFINSRLVAIRRAAPLTCRAEVKAGGWTNSRSDYFSGYFSSGEVVGAALRAEDLAQIMESTEESAKAGKSNNEDESVKTDKTTSAEVCMQKMMDKACAEAQANYAIFFRSKRASAAILEHDLFKLLPIGVVVMLLTVWAPTEAVMLSSRGSVVLAAVVGAMIKHNSDWRSIAKFTNIVIVIVEIGVLAAAVSSWVNFLFTYDILEEEAIRDCGSFNFDFSGLTIGQVVSASSAAAGGGAVRPWVQNVIELMRHRIDDLMGGLHCTVITALISQIQNKDIQDEFLRVLGCKGEPSAKTAARWSGFLQGMAVKMNLTNSEGESRMGHMAIDAVRQ